MRFKGRTQMMNKDGHMGVVKNTSIPIIKKGGVLEDGDVTVVLPSGDEEFSPVQTTLSRNSPMKNRENQNNVTATTYSLQQSPGSLR